MKVMTADISWVPVICQALCQIFHIQYFSPVDLFLFSSPFYKKENRGLKKLSNFFKISQLTNTRAGIWTQVSLTLNPHS